MADDNERLAEKIAHQLDGSPNNTLKEPLACLTEAEWQIVISTLLRSVPAQGMVMVPRTRYKELIDCLEAMASGKGGWAWEDVLDEHRAMLSAAESREGK
jgi:hypothetical protein